MTTKFSCTCLILALLALHANHPATLAEDAAGEGWEILFDGTDLEAFQQSPTAKWIVRDGVITLDGRDDGRLNNSDYLWTRKQYGDFVLELEVKVCEGYCNSGVFLRTADLEDPVFTGIEVQVSNSFGKAPNRGGTAGGIYDCLAPVKNTVKQASQWNEYRITCRNAHISVQLNGQLITDMDLDRWVETGKNPNGTPNKYTKPLKEFARRGYVGLQDHGRPVWYRNIRIKPVDGEPKYSVAPDEHGMVLRSPGGEIVLRYMTKKPADTNLTANSVCCLYPVNTPGGVRAVDLAPGDHRHHRGIFLAWHAMTCGDQRADFWGWGSQAPTEDRVITNRSVELATADASHAVLKVHNDWMVGKRRVLQEMTTITVRQQDGAYVIDEDFRLAADVDVQLDQTAFGGFCVKGRKDGKAAYYGPEGKAELPNPHHLKPETDWPERPWYDYVIQLDSGETVGVAVIDHPENPPSPWHNLEPIAMLNPCIVAPGPVSIEKGQTLRLRYRVVVHDGPVPTERLNRLAESW